MPEKVLLPFLKKENPSLKANRIGFDFIISLLDRIKGIIGTAGSVNFATDSICNPQAIIL